MEPIVISRYQSPVGEMMLGSKDGKLCICDWIDNKRRSLIDSRVCHFLNAGYEDGTTDLIQEACGQLDEYFAGRRKEFSIPLHLAGTDFQCRVWMELMKIPFGSTVSYAELALRVGNLKAVRAVAGTIASNPISILVPCHRVIGSNNTLTGYAGGLETKRALLALERDGISGANPESSQA